MQKQQNSQKAKDHFVSAGDLSKIKTKDLVLENPVTNAVKKGTQTFEWTTSNGYYKNSQGEKFDFLFELNPQIVWGISGSWDPKLSDDEKTLENIEGLQVCYPLTSTETIKEPTPEEATLEKFLKGVLWKKHADSMIEFNDKDLLDGPAKNACMAAQMRKNMEIAMKPIFEHPQIKKEGSKQKVSDTTKPKRVYLELVTQGKGSKLQCLTPIHGPGDKKVSWLKYLSLPGKPIRGTIHPIVHWKGAFWGQHGNNPYGGSVKMRIVEMNFVPLAANTLSYRRMLSPNTAPEEKSGSQEDGSEGNSDFRHPSGSGIVTSDFAKPGEDNAEDENVDNLMSETKKQKPEKNDTKKTNTNDKPLSEEEGGLSEGEDDIDGDELTDEDDEEEEKRKAEEEAKRKAEEKRKAEIERKKAMIAKKKAAVANKK